MNKELITECSKCGQRYKGWIHATPCCSGISFIVENGVKTTKMFMSALTQKKIKNYEKVDHS